MLCCCVKLPSLPKQAVTDEVWNVQAALASEVAAAARIADSDDSTRTISAASSTSSAASSMYSVGTISSATSCVGYMISIEESVPPGFDNLATDVFALAAPQ